MNPRSVTSRGKCSDLAPYWQIMTSVIGDEGENAEFPATMGVNAFRGYLNEFLLAVDDKPRAKKDKRNRRRTKKKKEKVGSIF